MSDHSSLRSWMDSAGLGHLTSHFIAQGVTEQNFPRLQLADFDRLGVISEGPPGAPPSAGQARQKLFKLIQVVRAESEREAQQNAAAAATLAANSISHAQARAQHYAHNARESTANSGEPTASYQPHIHAQWIPGGAQVAANASMSQHSQQSLRDDPPSSSSAFGLKSFFESARSGPAGALRSSPTSSPAQRPLNTQALNSNPEYLTLPLRANSILSPLRTFDSLAQSPAQSPAHSPARQSQHHREPPLSPNSPSKPPPAAIAAAAAFVARPMSPTSKPAQIYTYGSALNASSASQQQQPPAASVAPSSSVFTFAQSSSAAQQQPQPVQRTLAWGSAAVTPSTSAAPSQAPSVASSPQHPSSRPPPLVTATSSSSTTAAPSSFHARNFPSSPQSNSQQQQRAERSYHQHPAPSVAPSLRPEQPLTASHLTSSPISPRSSAALQAAHSALEQQRDRQRNERVAAAAVAAEASRERVQRERERLSRLQGHNSNEESKQSYQPAASPRVSATPQARPSSAATPSSTFAYPTHNQQQPHHRTLFQDQPEGQPSVPSTPSSSSYATSTNQPQRQSSNMYADRSSSNLNGPPPSARGGGGGGGRSFSPPPLSRMASARAPPAPAVPRSFGGQPLEEADFLDDDTNLANILFNTQEISLDGEEDEEEGEINGASAAAAVAAEAEDEGAAAASFYASASSAGNNAGASSKIRVAVRKRPLNARERARNESDITSVTGPTGPTSPTTRSSLANHSPNSVTIHEPKVKVDLTKFVESHTFHFDCAFGAATTNGAIYSRLVQPLVGFVMAGQGGRASCFAYGQTGAGKTHTLMGPEGGKREQSGLYVLAAEDIFRTLRDKQLEERVAKSRAGAQNQQRQQGQQGGVKYAHCSLFVSFFEIYSGRLFDLLHSRSKLVCRTDSNDRVHVVGLREKKVTDVAQLLDVITQGNKQRSTGQTGANVDSSRSHAILSISLKQIVPMAPAEVGRRAPLHHPTPDPSDPSAPASSSSASVFGSIVPGGVGRGGGQFRLKTVGKLSFIDLAGSERGADTAETDRRTRTEGAEINKSLLALKECWRALDQGGRHLPVRGSILTQVLKDSFVGNSRTVMIAAIAPGSASCEHTLNTLRYADRVKSLRRGAPISAMSVEQAAAATPAAAAAAAAAPSSQFDRSASAAAASGSGGKTARGGGGGATDRSSSSTSTSAAGPSLAFGNAPAVVDAYMPHQGRKLNTKITLLPPSASSDANSASPQRSSRAASLHTSASTGQLSVQSSPSVGSGLRSARGSSAQPASARGSVSSTPTAAAPQPSATESSSSLHARHRDLCARILLEEESLVLAHRSSIDAHMGGVKAELELLREFDGMNCSVDAYARQLKAMLRAKARAVQQLSDELDTFTAHLKEEEQMSAAVKRAQANGL